MVLVVRILGVVVVVLVVRIPVPLDRRTVAMTVAMTVVLTTADHRVVSAPVARVAQHPRIAGVLLAGAPVQVPRAAQMIVTTEMIVRSEPSAFASLISPMRSRLNSSTSRSPLNCAPCPMD